MARISETIESLEERMGRDGHPRTYCWTTAGLAERVVRGLVLMGVGLPAALACCGGAPAREPRAAGLANCYRNPDQADQACLRALPPLAKEPAECAVYHDGEWVSDGELARSGAGIKLLFQRAADLRSQFSTDVKELEVALARAKDDGPWVDQSIAKNNDLFTKIEPRLSIGEQAATHFDPSGSKSPEEKKAVDSDTNTLNKLIGNAKAQATALEASRRKVTDSTEALKRRIRDERSTFASQLRDPTQPLMSPTCYVEFETGFETKLREAARLVDTAAQGAESWRSLALRGERLLAVRGATYQAWDACTGLKDGARICQDNANLDDKARDTCRRGCQVRADATLASLKKTCLRQFAETGKPQDCAIEAKTDGDRGASEMLKTCSAECRKEGPDARKGWLADQAAAKRRAAEEAAEARRRPASSSSSPAISESCKKVLIECAQLVNQRGGSNAEMQGCVEQNGCAQYLKK